MELLMATLSSRARPPSGLRTHNYVFVTWSIHLPNLAQITARLAAIDYSTARETQRTYKMDLVQLIELAFFAALAIALLADPIAETMDAARA